MSQPQLPDDEYWIDTLELQATVEAPKSFRMCLVSNPDVEFWIPKSQIKTPTIQATGETGILTLPKWLVAAKEEELANRGTPLKLTESEFTVPPRRHNKN